jgi:FkbM family methyltransferase
MMFEKLLKEQLLKESTNFYTDNYDYYTHTRPITSKKKIINFAKRFFFSKSILSILLTSGFIYKKLLLGNILSLDKYLDKLDNLYNKLESEESKQLLLRLMAFKVLGYLKVKLPLNKPEFWDGIKKMKSLAKKDDKIELPYKPHNLYLHDLNEVGFPIKMYLHSIALFTTYTVNHYQKTISDNHILKAEEGDVVLDLGGCYGDTALYFAHHIGETGKVYSFEFIPSNQEIWQKNVDLNPELKDRIELVGNPVWDKSKVKMFYKDSGASSQVSFENSEKFNGTTETVAIDDFVKDNNLSSVDFIKTDIEAAEPYAINGAIETIKKFTPKLAISIYHNMDDFTGIIEQIDELNLGYKFYLQHATIYGSETVLFCEVA